ncbi:hydroxyacylglutathione hydrolase [Hahella sp. CR1]|uniref:hydroxyacylglutathione hydrolase n=1 Tax=Hahella sp. CR1 TaxID=2992807 RepID=UPI00244267B1|nr:hydroxyacylglutathione hydrolase [Hahella sp. CR1]MDG9667218.1 hydroxyacylglutathione hydrolase [Hahella sp. CR1]
MTEILPIPAFNDNYIWSIQNDQGDAWVVDPGDAQPVLRHLAENGLTLRGILITHHHHDHIGGVNELLANYAVPVYGFMRSAIKAITIPLQEGDRVELGDFSLEVLETPGHTLDHIAYFGEIAGAPRLFCGDTLFSAGCGRLFEGDPAMMRQSLDKLRRLPANTYIYCAHEYTLSNLRFAQAVMPESDEVNKRKLQCESLRAQGVPTLPAVLGEEVAYNPFLMAEHPAVRRMAQEVSGSPCATATDTFAAIRAWKDRF